MSMNIKFIIKVCIKFIFDYDLIFVINLFLYCLVIRKVYIMLLGSLLCFMVKVREMLEVCNFVI